MKKFVMVSILLSISLLDSVNAGILNGNTEDVISKSIKAAKSFPHSDCVGSLIGYNRKQKEIGGVALAISPYALLTCAHFCRDLNKLNPFIFFTGSSLEEEDGITIKLNPCNIIILSEYEEVLKIYGNEPKHICGVLSDRCDLAIIKLESQLPDKLHYPEFLDSKYKIKDQYGFNVSCGPISLSHEDKILRENTKHLFLSKVGNFDQCLKKDDPLRLTSSKIALKKFCFKTTPDMVELEGATRNGDSGAPIFIKIDEKFFVAGVIASGIVWVESNTESKHISNYGTATQPRLDWIKDNMGPRLVGPEILIKFTKPSKEEEYTSFKGLNGGFLRPDIHKKKQSEVKISNQETPKPTNGWIKRGFLLSSDEKGVDPKIEKGEIKDPSQAVTTKNTGFAGFKKGFLQ